MLRRFVERVEELKDRLEGSPKARAKLLAEATYATYVKAAVADGVLTNQELAYLERTRVQLGVEKNVADRLLEDHVVRHFRNRITSVNYTSAADAIELIRTVRTDLKALRASWPKIRRSLHREILAYLGRVLSTQWLDNVMDQAEAATFKSICDKFGLRFDEVAQHFRGTVQNELEAFIGAKDAANELDTADLEYVDRICNVFGLGAAVKNRLRADIERRMAVASVRKGEFRRFKSPILLDGSENCIFAADPAHFLQADKPYSEVGTFVLSDRRLYFAPFGGGQRSLLLKRILAVQPADNGVLVRGNKKNASGLYVVPEPDLALATLQTAVLIEKRHIQPNDVERDRYISQSVRHVVWHRDCGRCVQCGATQHLHFDHIIPFSRGGANVSENIQLLCVACNLAKGARI